MFFHISNPFIGQGLRKPSNRRFAYEGTVLIHTFSVLRLSHGIVLAFWCISVLDSLQKSTFYIPMTKVKNLSFLKILLRKQYGLVM